MADFFILWYFVRASQPRTVFWMLTQSVLSLAERSVSRYATCPALKNSFVLPNRNMSWSLGQSNPTAGGGQLVKAPLSMQLLRYFCRTSTDLDEFSGDVFAGLHGIGEHVSLLNKEVIAAEELLVGPPAAATWTGQT